MSNLIPTPSESARHYFTLLEQGRIQQAHQLLLCVGAQAGFDLLLKHFTLCNSDGFATLGLSLYDDFCAGIEQDCNTLEFLWLSLLQQANDARDARLVPLFHRLCSALLAEDVKNNAPQNTARYGLFQTGQSAELAFPAWLPTHSLTQFHPAASRLYDPADRILLGLIHDLSIFNRVQQGKFGLQQGKGGNQWQIQAEPDLKRCVEIEINYQQIVTKLDSHWNATGSLMVMDLIKFFTQHGFTVVPFHKHIFSPAPKYSGAAFYLTQHTRGLVSPNRWHFKHAHISRYMQVDRYGYAGFSQLAEDGVFRRRSTSTQPKQSDAEIAAWVKQLRAIYASGALPKVAQLDCAFPSLGQYERIIFAPLQIATDQVMQLAWLDNQDMVHYCMRHKRRGDLLMVKKHPYDQSAQTARFLTELARQADVLITEGSIYSLLNLADVVLTCNSGAGFEALLFGKPVITCGRSDYQMATAAATDENRLAALLNGDEEAFPNEAARNLFVMNYCREMYCVDRSRREKERWLSDTFAL